jgi:hypothetical protein
MTKWAAKSGNASTGDVMRAVFRVQNASSMAGVQMKRAPFLSKGYQRLADNGIMLDEFAIIAT